MTSSNWPAAFLTGLLLVCLPLRGEQLKAYEAVEPHMGTLFRLKIYAPSEEQAKQAFAAAFTRVTDLDNTLSDYKPGSELDQISARAAGEWIPVSSDLFRVVQASQKLSAGTGGAFDITIGPLSHLWRQARKDGHPPSAAQIAEAKTKCGYRKLHLDAKTRAIKLDESGMQLDVGAIAKGDAADQALQVLSECGIKSALVAASGDLAFSDAPPGTQGWKIGLDSLDTAESPFTRVLVLTNGAVSTSGATEQHLDSAGVRYSHILNPKTGIGLTQSITANVIARHGIEADGFSTALSVLGVERGLKFIESQPGAYALFVIEANGNRTVRQSRGFELLRTAP